MSKFKDITGQKINRLTILEKCYKHNRLHYKCQCDCGNVCYVRSDSIKNGHIKSCGCLHKELASKLGKNSATHKKSNTRLYKIWSSMKNRCYDNNATFYKHYGGRGIAVCGEWLDDFMAFYNWSMSQGYKDGLTIDRINVNGNYEPNNCHWVDMKQQQRNRRNNKNITINGETHCLMEWCEILGLNYKTIHMRLCRNWTIERALELK